MHQLQLLIRFWHKNKSRERAQLWLRRKLDGQYFFQRDDRSHCQKKQWTLELDTVQNSKD